MGWGKSVSAIIVGGIPETINSSSLVTLCCIDCPLYIVVSVLGVLLLVV
jgi:hypothetical protein